MRETLLWLLAIAILGYVFVTWLVQRGYFG